MRARFRIRTAQGQELSFASEEMFTDFVRSGEVSPDDLVYDGLSGEWAPARTHTLVLDLQYEAEESAGEPQHVVPSAELLRNEEVKAAPTAEEGGIGFGLSLAEEKTPEEEAATFVAEMEAERSTGFEEYDTLDGFKKTEGSAGIVEDVVTRAPRAVPARSRTIRPSRSESRDSPAPPRRPRAARRSGFPLLGVLAGALAAAAIAAGVIYGPGLIAERITEDAPPPDTTPALPPALPDTEEALRGRAAERFLARIRRELGSLPAIPQIWLDGRYLAGPSAYPDVRRVWETYVERMREIREDEVGYYAEAYLSALDDARVTGSTRTLRLAPAVSAFEGASGERLAHYTRVETLALSALRLHDLLTNVEGSITYEPAAGSRLSADPVIEAVGVDEETQLLLNETLDQVLDALYAGGLGAEDAAEVPSWAFEGVLGTVIR